MPYYNERLMLAREKRGLTQKELSYRLGLKQQQYARYEKGINIMPVTYLYNICIVLNISIDVLLYIMVHFVIIIFISIIK